MAFSRRERLSAAIATLMARPLVTQFRLWEGCLACLIQVILVFRYIVRVLEVKPMPREARQFGGRGRLATIRILA